MKQRETHILQSLSKGNSPFVRALCFIVISSYSLSANAVTMGKLKGMQGFQAVALAVAMVNKAMRDAAQNPMDKWRRQNVAHTMGLLPIAIQALASDFKSGQLHDGDLAYVQGMLGGFVDVNAANAYDKFAKNPSAANIPQLGANFPKEYLDRAEKESATPGSGQAAMIGYNESNSKNDSVALVQPSGFGANSQVTNLNGMSLTDVVQKSVSSGTSGKPEAKASGNTASINYNENARPSGLVGGEAKEAKSSSASPTTESFDKSVAREISSVESELGLSIGKGRVVSGVKAPVQKDPVIDEFFTETKPQAKAKKGAHKEATENYKLSVKPKYWSIVPVLKYLSVQFEMDAKADPPAGPPVTTGGGSAPPAAGTGGKPGGEGDKGSGCQQCQGGGGQGGGGGGGGGGGAGDMLMGIAAMIAAAAPMVAAAMQADADKKIAKINADAQIQMTEITAENSKYLADSQSRMAQQQSTIAQQINKTNNDEQTKRLNMQLAEVKNSREQAYKSEQEKRAIEKEYNDQRIALAQKQADDNLKLARKTFDAQLTQAGLSSGFSGVNKGATGGLSVDRITNSYASTGTGGSANNRLTAAATNNSGLTGPNLGGGAATGQAFTKETQRAVASDRLLASVSGRGITDDEEEVYVVDKKTGKKVKVKKKSSGGTRIANLSYGATSGSSARGVAVENSGVSMRSLGSSRGALQRISDTDAQPKSDLAKFQAVQASSASGSSDFVRWKTSSAETAAVQPASLGSSTHGGAYNAPTINTGSRGAVRGIYGN